MGASTVLNGSMFHFLIEVGSGYIRPCACLTGHLESFWDNDLVLHQLWLSQSDLASTHLASFCPYACFCMHVDVFSGKRPCRRAKEVIEAINRMPNHLTAGIVSNNPIFINEAVHAAPPSRVTYRSKGQVSGWGVMGVENGEL